MQILYSLVGNSAKFLTDSSMTVMLKAMPCCGSCKQTLQCLVSQYKNQMPCSQILYNLGAIV